MKEQKIYSVSELNKTAKQFLNEISAGGIWVKGEIVSYKLAENGRYSSFSLCEKQEGSTNVLAQVQVMCWGPELEGIELKLQALDKSLSLKNGLIVQLKCSFDLWVNAGRYQIIAKDIEPSVTLGEIHLIRAKIFSELKELGLDEKNKKTVVPLCPIKVALISSRGCAGYNDFINELFLSGYPFQVHFYHASMQGEVVEKEVVWAIGRINKKHRQYDVLALVRGGGSELDLKWFDNKNIGISIANCRLPVLTGIGHEINLSVADMIAHSFFKTPTAAASFLTDRVKEYERSVSCMTENIHEGVKPLIAESKREVNDIIKNIVSEIRPLLSSKKASTFALNAGILKSVPIFIRNKRALLAGMEEKLSSYDPRKTVKLGYSITRDSRGKILKKLIQVSEKDQIITSLSDGSIFSVVAGKEGLDGKQES